jgi:Tfp pilus assembly protein PilN
MINLLSPNDKKQLRAARRNVVLLRYNIVALLTILAISFVYAGGFFITMRSNMTADEQLNEDTARTRNYAEVQKTSQEFAKNLTVAKTILTNEITYSTLITNIAKTLPSGTVLDNLTLNPTMFGKEISLGASTKTYSKALELKASLEKSALFSNVSIESVNSSTGAEGEQTKYPIAVILKATFATEAQIKALKGKSS